jgi:hypothetical protein
MHKLVAPLAAAFILALAGPALAGGGFGCGGAVQSVEADGPVSTPVDTATTATEESSG